MKAVLTYHSVDDTGSPVSVSPKAFQAHLQWLTTGRVSVLPLEALVENHDGQDDAVAVTFDDGFLNTRGPVSDLRSAGLPVTIFVVTGHAGGTNAWGGRPAPGIPTLELLDWDDLASLRHQGARIEAHTRRHSHLTSLPDDALDEELLGGRQDLHARLGVDSAHLAYPYGEVDDRVAERAARYYRWGHTTDFRLLTHVDAPLRLPRLDMYYFRAPGALESWGTVRFRRRVGWCRVRRTLRSAILGGRAAPLGPDRR